eukprot:6455684-Ditylum_brightwellii.AAC.1
MEEHKVAKDSSVSKESSLLNMDDYIASSGDFTSLSDSSGDVMYSTKKNKTKQKETKKQGRKTSSVLSRSKDKK